MAPRNIPDIEKEAAVAEFGALKKTMLSLITSTLFLSICVTCISFEFKKELPMDELEAEIHNCTILVEASYLTQRVAAFQHRQPTTYLPSQAAQLTLVISYEARLTEYSLFEKRLQPWRNS
jgi:hypothetical protein